MLRAHGRLARHTGWGAKWEIGEELVDQSEQDSMLPVRVGDWLISTHDALDKTYAPRARGRLGPLPDIG